MSYNFPTIVADPPWQVSAGRQIGNYVRAEDGSQPFGVRDNKSRKLAYPTMSVEEIAALPIASHVAGPNSHLYLWTVNRYLHEAFHVMEAWGFKYSTTLVWAKKPMGGGLGGCYGLATEFCLFGRRGSLAAMRRMGRNWYDWKRPYDQRGKPRHSAKPPEFYQLVQAVSPGARIELFAREKRPDWFAWGNEVESDITMEPAL